MVEALVVEASEVEVPEVAVWEDPIVVLECIEVQEDTTDIDQCMDMILIMVTDIMVVDVMVMAMASMVEVVSLDYLFFCLSSCWW